MEARAAFNVTERGAVHASRTLLFAHGFGCDQNMWRLITPEFEADHRIVLFDYVGMGGARAEYDADRYASLEGYAADVLRICRELDLTDVVFIGHSVSSSIGALAQIAAPELIRSLVMVGPSPRYINDGDYVGGFERADIDGLLDALASNYLGWSQSMAPVIMGNPERPELSGELETSFCTVDPRIAAGFARATFLSDNRQDLPKVSASTLVLQSREDAIAPVVVGEYVADRIPDSQLVILDSAGHCPHLSAPDQVVGAIRGFLN